jgi:hypothetical protein
MLIKARVFTLEVLCPVQKSSVSVPVYDCLRIHWDRKEFQIYCPACKQNHIIDMSQCVS